jgi:mono/diheme cytochrome c family protein
MTWIAAALLAGFAVVVLVAYFVPSDDDDADGTTAAQLTTETTTADDAEGPAEETDTTSPDEGESTDGALDEALAGEGEQIASAQGCTACHSIDGSDGIGPTWLGVYDSEIELDGGEVVTADGAYLEEGIVDPNARVRAGFGPSMPPFDLSDEELVALLEYFKSLSE